tara:strand:- start:17 stop:208 length:192 start_codon:yes stop_codon:yes gene_type:complete
MAGVIGIAKRGLGLLGKKLKLNKTEKKILKSPYLKSHKILATGAGVAIGEDRYKKRQKKLKKD